MKGCGFWIHKSLSAAGFVGFLCGRGVLGGGKGEEYRDERSDCVVYSVLGKCLDESGGFFGWAGLCFEE